MFGGEVGIERLKVCFIFGAKICGRINANKERGDFARGEFRENGVEVGFGLLGGQATQNVVAAKGYDDGINVGRQGPVDA